MVKQILGRLIQLTEQFTKALDRAVVTSRDHSFIPHQLKSKSKELAGLLRQLSCSNLGTYDRPARAIINQIEETLDRCLFRLLKHPKCIIIKIIKKRFSTFIPITCFLEISVHLDASIGDVSWLIRFWRPEPPDEDLRRPPMLLNEPTLWLVWEEVAILHHPAVSVQARCSAAASLGQLARDHERYMTLIIREGGVEALLKLMEEGPMEGQENAARTLGWLGRSCEIVEHLHADVCKVFAKTLREGSLKVQVAVAKAVSMLSYQHPELQDVFAQHDVVRLLIGHLAFETVEVHSSKTHSNDNANANEDPATREKNESNGSQSPLQTSGGDSAICRSLAESTSLHSFGVLLEKGSENAQLYSVLALVVIMKVAEEDADLRRCAFSPNSPTWKYIADQLLLKITENVENSDFQVFCIKAIGNLAKTFGSRETRMINRLVQLLNGSKYDVTEEACIALTKFSCTDNCFHIDHSKAIISAGGVKHSEELAQAEVLAALTWASKLSYMTKYEEVDKLLFNIPVCVPEMEELAQAGVLPMLEWETEQSYMSKDETVLTLLQGAKSRLNLHQSKASRGVH
ncbi:PREDICTED: Armadillo [Prunus dulcis]|uniref:PREDICTED: Armadillo n=2 Tax=Prunus dulcis TaxID=3755 RepID=A0A5E4E5E1_PRUDU|nr:PREDICTED: Armadillo [Prunus dulcis]